MKFMKLIMIVLLASVAIVSCNQLNPGDSIPLDDDDTTEFELYEIGDSYDFKLHYSEDNSLYVELSGFSNPGIYSLQFSCLSSDYYHDRDVIFKLYNTNSCIGEGDYQIYYHYFDNEDDRRCGEVLFEVNDTMSKYAKLYLRNSYDDGKVYTISFLFIHEPYNDPFDDYDSRREFTLGTSLTGCFSRLLYDPSDAFILTGIQENVVYTLSVDYDYSDSLFGFNEYSTPYFSFNSKLSINTCFQTSNRGVIFFSVSGANTLQFSIRGFTGISYELLAQPELKTFLPDIFEPDNGPISGTRETIIDTGWTQFQGESHTLIKEETDWISFIPAIGFSYRIYVILEDTWYDPETEEDFHLNINAQLIKPNGYEVEIHCCYYFNQIPQNPVISSIYITWENPAGSIDPWFIKIYPDNRGKCLQYSILIEKIFL